MKIGFFILLVSCGTALAIPHYVATNSPGPFTPFTSWETAATNIQNAIDASGVGDVVWVSNGLYNTASTANGRVDITKAMTVRSVNGPANTTIQGGVNIRGVYMVNSSTLIGFTVSGVAVRAKGDN